MYHISDLKKYNRCPRIPRLEELVGKAPYQRYIRLDDEVTALAAKKVGARNCFIGERGDPAERAINALSTHEWLMKARFEYGGLRIKVPFLHRTKEGFDLYFLFIGLYPHNDDMQFYCDTVWVLESLGIPLSAIHMIHLNASYVRGKELEPEKLFVVSDVFYNNRSRPGKPVEQAIREAMRDLTPLIEQMKASEQEPLGKPVRSSRCAGRQKCRYYTNCFPNETEEPDNSILFLASSQHRYEMREEGIRSLQEADISRIEGSRMQYAQIMADRNGGLFFDRLALTEWLKQLSYPITFLDFEWEHFAIPPYEGMKPFDVLLFEYSIHVLREDGTIQHEVFLSTHDDRKALAESLIRTIPKTGSVVAYNGIAAEMVRIRELADLYPELAEELLAINERIADLQEPFVMGLVYDVKMRGSWTLKQIMSVLEENSYTDLDIHHGMEAVFEWRHLDREEADIDREKIIEELKAYCSMDSYSTVRVYQWLASLVQE